MHTTVDYAEHETRRAKDAAAVRDVYEWLTPGQRKAIVVNYYIAAIDIGPRSFTISAARKWLNQLSFALSFCGVGGYPVKAMKRAWLEAVLRGTGPQWLLIDEPANWED